MSGIIRVVFHRCGTNRVSYAESLKSVRKFKDSFLKSNSCLEVCACRRPCFQKQPFARQIHLKPQMCVGSGELTQTQQDPGWEGTSLCRTWGGPALKATWLDSHGPQLLPTGGAVVLPVL